MSSAGGSSGPRGRAHVAAAGLLAVVWQLPYFDRWMSPLDEGHILAFAQLLAQGGELYRDASLLALPGAFYLLELGFEWFGPSIRLARWLVVFEFALLVGIAFALLRRVVPLRAAWLGVVALLLYRVWAFPHWQMYSYSTTALLALACALLALVIHLETQQRWVLGLAGLWTGLGVLCKQDYGASGWLAMNAVLWLSLSGAARGVRARRLAWYNLPAVAVGVATAVHFLSQGLLLEMMRQTFVNHLIGITSFDYPSLPPILPLFEQEPLLRGRYGFSLYAPSILATVAWDRVTASVLYRDTVLWDLALKLCFYLPYLLAVVAATRIWWLRAALRDPERRPAYLTELALSVYAILLLAALSRPVDWAHLAVLCWPFVCLLVVHVHALVRARPRAGRALLVLGLLPALAFAAGTIQLAWELRAQFGAPLAAERAGIYVRRAEAHWMRQAVEYAQTHSEPGEPFAVLPYFPLVSFLADRPAPHRAAWVFWPVEDVPGRQEQIIAALAAGRSSHLLYHFTQWVEFPTVQEFAPDLFDHLVANYEIDRVLRAPCWVQQFAGLRRSSRVPAGTLLAPAGAPRERWPFREVLATRCGERIALPSPAGIDADSRLRTAVGVHPDRWCAEAPASVTFSIDAVSAGERTSLYRRTLAPRRKPADRGWFEVDLSLAELAGRGVSLELATACSSAPDEPGAAGGFGLPRVGR